MKKPLVDLAEKMAEFYADHAADSAEQDAYEMARHYLELARAYIDRSDLALAAAEAERDALRARLEALTAALAPALVAEGAAPTGPWDCAGRSPLDIWAGDGRYIGALDTDEAVCLTVTAVNAVRAAAALLSES